MATTWQISRRAGECAATGRAFADGERHVSFLRVREGALERVDLCLAAWRAERERIAAENDDEPLLYWTTRHQIEPKKTVQLDLDSLAHLFVRLEGHASQEVREFRYVLCLLLMRKRRVKVEKVERKGGVESFVVKRPRDDTRYTVFVFDFEPERLEALRAQLQAVFDGAEGPDGIRLEASDEESDEGSGEQAVEGAVEGSSSDASDGSAAADEPEDAPGHDPDGPDDGPLADSAVDEGGVEWVDADDDDDR